MVSSAHPLASVAGLRTLMEGGNAIDAAVAVASTLGATEMGLSGIGGVGWMHIYHAKSNTHTCLDYQGWSPYAAELSAFSSPEEAQRGVKSWMVPGCALGWCTALERFGTMDRASVFKYVIDVCENGHPVTVHAANIVNTYEPWLAPYPASMAKFFPNGTPMRPGQILKQPDLARTYRAVVEGGPDAFYKGEIADKIVNYAQANGGLITKQDLADLNVEWVEPLGISYRGYRVYGPPPPSSAMQWLQTLKLLEGYDLAAMGHNSIEHLHTLIELEKLAIADRVAYNVLPGASMQRLLSDDYVAERRKLIAADRSADNAGMRYASVMADNVVKPGDIGMREATTHFNVVDSEGNAVSCTQSLGGFGSGVVVPETGILFNDFNWWFDLNPDSPNVIAPHKKVEMCLSPGMIFRDDKVFALMGTPGSHGIMETTPQFMSNLMDFNMSVQAAIEAPRVRPIEGNRMIAEQRIPQEVIQGLEARGHVVELQPDFSMAFGGAQGIMIDPYTGALTGGGDPRRDGYAIGW
jgi:gamma-glutamyltranspeptidase/glutathione hydrolase